MRAFLCNKPFHSSVRGVLFRRSADAVRAFKLVDFAVYYGVLRGCDSADVARVDHGYGRNRFATQIFAYSVQTFRWVGGQREYCDGVGRRRRRNARGTRRRDGVHVKIRVSRQSEKVQRSVRYAVRVYDVALASRRVLLIDRGVWRCDFDCGYREFHIDFLHVFGEIRGLNVGFDGKK